MFRYFQCPSCSKNFIFEKAMEGVDLECPACEHVCRAEPSGMGKDTVVGHCYLLKHRVDVSDLGHTYIAHNLKTDSVCQVCLFLSDLTDGLSDVNEFRYFLLASSKICTPAHIQLIDSGVDEGICFVVWDNRDTECLTNIVERAGGLQPLQAGILCRRIAESLANAWQQSALPHLGLSPEAVYTDPEGNGWLRHFGLTYFLLQDETFLETGLPVLTPRFVSPALALGEGTADCRCDMYSLGALLHYMILAHPPFEDQDDLQVLRNTPLLLGDEQLGRTGPAFAALIQRLMATTPGDGFSDWAQVLDALDEAIRSVRQTRGTPVDSESLKAVLPASLAIAFDESGRPVFQPRKASKPDLPPRSPRKTSRFTVNDSLERLASYSRQRTPDGHGDRLYGARSPRDPKRTAFRRQQRARNRAAETRARERAVAAQSDRTSLLVWVIIVLLGVVAALLTALVVTPSRSKAGAPPPPASGDVPPVQTAERPTPAPEPAPAIPAPRPPPARPSMLDRQRAILAADGDSAPKPAGPLADITTDGLPPQENLRDMWTAAEEMGPLTRANFDQLVLAYRKIAQEAMLLREPQWEERAKLKVGELEAVKDSLVDDAKQRFLGKLKALLAKEHYDAARRLCDDPGEAWADEFGTERLVWRRRIMDKIESRTGQLGGQLAEVEELVARAVADGRITEAATLFRQVAAPAEGMYGEDAKTFTQRLTACTPDVLKRDLASGLKAQIGVDSDYELSDGTLVGLRILAVEGDDLLVRQHIGRGEVKKTVPISQLSLRQRLTCITSADADEQALKRAVYAQTQGAYVVAMQALRDYGGLLAALLKREFPKAARNEQEGGARKLLTDSLAVMGLKLDENAADLTSRIAKATLTPEEADLVAGKLEELETTYADSAFTRRNRVLITTFRRQAERFRRAEKAPDKRRQSDDEKIVRASVFGDEGTPRLEDAMHRLQRSQTLLLEPGVYSTGIKVLQSDVTIEGQEGVVLREDLIVYKDNVTLKGLRLEDANVHVVTGIDGTTLRNCVLDKGTLEFMGHHVGATLENCRIHGLILPDVTDLHVDHCTILASKKRDRHVGKLGEINAISGSFSGKILNSIIYSPDGVAMSLTDTHRSRTAFYNTLIHGDIGLALVRSARKLVSIQEERDFHRQIGRTSKIILDAPEFVNPEEEIYKLFANSPGSRASRNELDLGILTDDKNRPIDLTEER